MKIWALLSAAFAGWVEIVRGEADWRRHFVITMPGLVTALVLFLVFAFLSVVVASTSVGIPTLSGFIAVMLVQALGIAALVIGLYATRMMVPTEAKLLDALVPGVYLLVLYIILGTILSLFGGAVLLLLWAIMAVLLYRLGRMAAGWSLGVSVGFALLTLVLLVGMPLTLYMLTGPTAAPAA
ncbi:hypothetical protein [Devosia sp. 63-57]|uniref:hypothetical protein n=1 Tax=Devosia sp. 63-57 TaxID=1895751 RepID=UPI000869DA58|nr:hypothetical protein [Devosia sp. 63-57]ODT47696.1 MAG: hypothetical protein ABS74_15775 [Pelagibacterium sp. SCN 63-126]ODU88248.1 MAG: hypothetical protein ABT14_03370 [Pelagibacterium sp. SCN 63-17]OJX42596.1 MAG: hypothetical protein BGO80_14085 [Devosia sp. 63-57]